MSKQLTHWEIVITKDASDKGCSGGSIIKMLELKFNNKAIYFLPRCVLIFTTQRKIGNYNCEKDGPCHILAKKS